jgi:hypothetical protein
MATIRASIPCVAPTLDVLHIQFDIGLRHPRTLMHCTLSTGQAQHGHNNHISPDKCKLESNCNPDKMNTCLDHKPTNIGMEWF